MNKIDLLEMDAADMVDVIHYFFDEDMRYGSYESALMHSKFRERIYGSLYLKEYRYTIKDSSDTSPEYSENGDEIKPYIPPTEFDPEKSNPFGAALDAPLG